MLALSRGVLLVPVLALLAACGGNSTATSSKPASAPTASSGTVTTTASDGSLPSVTDSKKNHSLDLTLSGQVTGRMTDATITPSGAGSTGLICQRPSNPIGTIFQGPVDGQAVTIQVIIEKVAPGASQALIVVVPAEKGSARPSAGPLGANSGALSTYQGRAVIAQDGMSASIDGDLAVGGGPILQRISGSWRCTSGS
jgi:hypothetical protein